MSAPLKIESLVKKKARAKAVLAALEGVYPAPKALLDWATPWQLLSATMLAAQCTDARVNLVTPELWRRFPGPAETAQADIAELKRLIHSTGFYNNKAKHLIGAAKRIMTVYGGEVPKTLAELTTLPGVARKTANIVSANAYGVLEGIAVDTHVKRLAFRMGFTDETDPDRIERDLTKLFPKAAWGEVNHRLVLHGRALCPARSPRCPECFLAELCPKRLGK